MVVDASFIREAIQMLEAGNIQRARTILEQALRPTEPILPGFYLIYPNGAIEEGKHYTERGFLSMLRYNFLSDWEDTDEKTWAYFEGSIFRDNYGKDWDFLAFLDTYGTAKDRSRKVLKAEWDHDRDVYYPTSAIRNAKKKIVREGA